MRCGPFILHLISLKVLRTNNRVPEESRTIVAWLLVTVWTKQGIGHVIARYTLDVQIRQL